MGGTVCLVWIVWWGINQSKKKEIKPAVGYRKHTSWSKASFGFLMSCFTPQKLLNLCLFSFRSFVGSSRVTDAPVLLGWLLPSVPKTTVVYWTKHKWSPNTDTVSALQAINYCTPTTVQIISVFVLSWIHKAALLYLSTESTVFYEENWRNK